MPVNRCSRRSMIAMGLVLAVVMPLSTTGAYAAAPPQGQPGSVEVTHLGVDGRYDSPLGLGDLHPVLSWQAVETSRAKSHPCYHPGATVACPADKQTAYEVEVAESEQKLKAGDLVWTTGRVAGAEQQVVFAGTLRSRETLVWRVRVWDADEQESDWSAPATWSVGLLEQSDWGNARWIDYPDRVESQPLPDLRPAVPGAEQQEGRRRASLPVGCRPSPHHAQQRRTDRRGTRSG